MKSVWPRIAASLLLIAAIVLGQCILPPMHSPVVMAPRAPMEACCSQTCGCSADVKANNQCCCGPSTAATETAQPPPGHVELMLKAAQCHGEAPGAQTVNGQFFCVLVEPARVTLPVTPESLIESPIQFFRGVKFAPPVPPPRSLSFA